MRTTIFAQFIVTQLKENQVLAYETDRFSLILTPKKEHHAT